MTEFRSGRNSNPSSRSAAYMVSDRFSYPMRGVYQCEDTTVRRDTRSFDLSANRSLADRLVKNESSKVGYSDAGSELSQTLRVKPGAARLYVNSGSGPGL